MDPARDRAGDQLRCDPPPARAAGGRPRGRSHAGSAECAVGARLRRPVHAWDGSRQIEDVAGPTMTRIVDGLCELGLAERRPHPDSGPLGPDRRHSGRQDAHAQGGRDGGSTAIVAAMAELPVRDQQRLAVAAPLLLRIAEGLRGGRARSEGRTNGARVRHARWSGGPARGRAGGRRCSSVGALDGLCGAATPRRPSARRAACTAAAATGRPCRAP